MTVNPFWLGVLMTIVAELVVLIIAAMVNSHRAAYEEKDDGLEEMLSQIEGKKVRIVRKNGYLIGEMLEDDDDEEE